MMGTGIPIDIHIHHMNDERLKKFLEDHKDKLDALAAKTDEDIDFSEMPELTEEDWKHAVRGKYYKPVKQRLTLRLDADVVDWFKRTQPKYQTAMNDALRRYMIEQRRKSG